MFFRKKYSLLLAQNKDLLTESLKTEQDKKHPLQGPFSESVYELKFDYDQWIVSSKPKILEGIKIKPDAYIQLTTVSEKMTHAEVIIKLSPIWLLVLIFIHLAIIFSFLLPPNTATTFFGKDLGPNWLNLAVVVLCNIITFNLIIWIAFLIETNRLKKMIEKLFGVGQII